MSEDQRAEIGDFDFIVGALLAHIGQAEHDPWRGALRLEIALHRGDLGRLIGQSVEPVQIADDDLRGRDDRRHPQRH